MPDRQKKRTVINELDRLGLVELLKTNKGNISETARQTGIHRTTLAKMLHESNLIPIRSKPAVPVVVDCDPNDDYNVLADKVIRKALLRLSDIVDREKDIDKLTKLIQGLTRSMDNKQDKKAPEVNALSVAIQNITNNYHSQEIEDRINNHHKNNS